MRAGNGAVVVMPREGVLFPLKPFEGESFFGFTTRLAQWNCFETRMQLLKLIGFADAHDKGFGQALNDDGRLARRMGLTDQELGKLVGRAEGEQLRSELERSSRYVSPTGLREAPFHRTAWSLWRLPFCPENQEALINFCPPAGCGKPLGWLRVPHVERCEHCGFDLRAAPTALLKGKDGFLLQALSDLAINGRRNEGNILYRNLPAAISDASPSDLLYLIASIAKMAAATRTQNYKDLNNYEKSLLLIEAARIIYDYPRSLDDPRYNMASAHHTLFHYGRGRLAQNTVAYRLSQALYQDWEPCPRGTPLIRKHRLTEGKLTLREAARLMRVTNGDMRKILDLGLLEAPNSRGVVRQYQWLDPQKVQEGSKRLADRMSWIEFSQTYGLPLAGVRQLVVLGILPENRDPIVTTLHGDEQLLRPSAVEVVSRLERLLRIPGHDQQILPLEDLFKGIGAQDKPWGPIIRAALDRAIGLYFGTGAPGDWRFKNLGIEELLARDILDGRADWLKHVTMDEAPPGRFSRVEVEAYLNCFPRDVSWLVSAGLLPEDFDDPSVRNVGRDLVSSREITWRWRVSPALIASLATAHGIQKVGPFWPRAAVERYFLERFPHGRPN